MRHDPGSTAAAVRMARHQQPGLLDRAIAYFAPGVALNRARSRVQMAAAAGGGVIGPRRGRQVFNTWPPSARTADAAVNPDLPELHAMVSDLVVSSPIAQAAQQIRGTHIVGPGLQMRPSVDRELLGLGDDQAEEAEADILRRWRMWAHSPDASMGRDGTFPALTRLALESMSEKGDVIGVLTRHPGRPPGGRQNPLAVQLIEAERLNNPDHKADGAFGDGTISAGVERTAAGVIAAYYFSDQHPGSASPVGMTWSRVPAFGAASGRRNVLHPFRARRVGQSRGLSDYAVVIELIKQATNYTEAEVSAAVKAAFYTIFIETPYEQSLAANADSARTEADKLGPEQLEAGIFDMMAGEKATSPVPGRPNDGTAPFLHLLLELVGSSLKIPHDVLASRFNDSFSASQAAINVFWVGVEDDRELMVREWCDPAYGAWFDLEVAQGRHDAPGYLESPLVRQAWLGARWTGRPKPVIRADLEAKSAVVKIGAGLSSRAEEVNALSGRDADAVHTELAREQRRRIADGLDAPVAEPGDAEQGDI